jgi:hypothetical protein
VTYLLAFGLGFLFLFLVGLQARLIVRGQHRSQLFLITVAIAGLQAGALSFVLASLPLIAVWATGNAVGAVLSTYVDKLW